VVEQIVVQFPAAAAWLIVTLVGAIVLGGGWAVKKFIGRLDAIESLLSSEIKTLREMQHATDVRVATLEGQLRANSFGRRWDDSSRNGIGDD
jgi:Tfp pilus assembly protein PilO